MKTTIMAKEGGFQRKCYLVDVKGKILGRAASKVAKILRGKHKAIFTPHTDTGDRVIVINADKIAVTGNKMDAKVYRQYSGYPSGLKERTLRTMMELKPTEVFKKAVRGMLPHNRLGDKTFKKLRVYTGDKHPHSAQKPEILEV